MKLEPGSKVILTGATGGLGRCITDALARRRLKLVLVAYPGVDLDELVRSASGQGSETVCFAADLRDPAQRTDMLRRARSRFGPVDVLINNAGVEFTAPFHELSDSNLRDILNVNLEAPMSLTRDVLPEMLTRQRGHIVNISSLAGKSGPAYQEPYAATKAALIAFSASLRATYRGYGISASVVAPGFVEAGIYANLKARSGCSAPALLGTSPPEAVARAVIRAIENDLPDLVVNPIPVRPLFAFTALFPSAGAWLADKLGANEFFRRVVEAEKRTGRNAIQTERD